MPVEVSRLTVVDIMIYIGSPPVPFFTAYTDKDGIGICYDMAVITFPATCCHY